MAGRYGQLILSDGIAAIPVALYYKQAPLDLLAQEVWFVSAILARKWNADLPYPDLQEMAANAGITVRQLRRYRASLESRGYLLVQERYDPATGRQLPNSYDFRGLFTEIEALLAADPVPANEIREPDAPRPDPDNPTRDYSFVARYGRVIAAAGIAAIPQALFTYQRALHLSAVQVWFICYILAHRWSTDLPYPSLRLMAGRTGYSERHLHDIKDSLVAAGYLRVIGRVGQHGSQDTNAYDFAGLFTALISRLEGQGKLSLMPSISESERTGSVQHTGEETSDETRAVSLTRTPRVRRGRQRASATQAANEASYQVSVRHEAPEHAGPEESRTHGSVGWGTASSVGSRTYSSEGRGTSGSDGRGTHSSEERGTDSSEDSRTDSSQGSGTYSSERSKTEGSEERGTSGSEAGRTAGSEGTRTPGSDEKESIQVEPIQAESDSNRVTRQKNTGNASAASPRYSPYIAGVILDYSRELGDALHAAANATQAAHLWHESGLDEEAFVAQLHEAYARVRRYQGKQGLGYIENKMAYFFRTLRDVLASDTPCRVDPP
jgi:hypothetical protein